MQTRFVGHRIHTHISGMIRQCRIELPLRHAQRRIEHIIQCSGKLIVSTHKRNQVADVVLHIPTIDITIVFIIIIAGTQTSVITIIQRSNEFAVFIFRMEESGLRIKYIPVVIRTLQVVISFVLLA